MTADQTAMASASGPLVIPPLIGPRLYLRQVTEDDVSPEYLAWLADDEVVSHLEVRFAAQSMETLRQFVAGFKADRSRLLLGIFLNDLDKHVGNLSFSHIDWNHYIGVVGLMIGDRAQWGRGLATEALVLARELGFRHLHLHRLEAGIYADNVGSVRAFVKAGFSLECRLEQRRLHQGQFVDEVLMGCRNPDFRLR
ncbi:MAG: GNAT family N-acetyltransferase [Deltaproteobacteria bacterium]|nr:GNAT family N-acetyltransferase [Deltaproteobacteria bacterium]